jgi:hypothetical protein
MGGGLFWPQALSKAALADKEEWVGVMARAVGSFNGHLDLDAAAAAFSAVRRSPCLATAAAALALLLLASIGA